MAIVKTKVYRYNERGSELVRNELKFLSWKVCDIRIIFIHMAENWSFGVSNM
jgi:hypothetical protein